MSKIKNLLLDVCTNNNFYQNIVREYNIKDVADISQYPVLSRQQLQNGRYDMFTDGYITKYFSNRLRRQFSSGSSGVPVNVYWDYTDYYASTLALWRKRSQYYNIHSYDRFVMFTLNTFNTKFTDKEVYYINDPTNVLTINATMIYSEADYCKIIEILNEFHPVWLYIQPFILNKLIQVYLKYNLLPPESLKYIESVGELLSDDLRRRAEHFFKVPIANMYGSEEMNGIAYECPYHHMHILTDNVFVECKDSEGNVRNFGEGEAIITNLNNKAMPLIRYNQGDIISLNNSANCKCGDFGPWIDVIKGRSMDSISIGKFDINSYLLSEIISETNNILKDIIIDYQFFYYKRKKELKCLVKIDEKRNMWYETTIKTIKRIFANKIVESTVVHLDVSILDKGNSNTKKFRVLEIKE